MTSSMKKQTFASTPTSKNSPTRIIQRSEKVAQSVTNTPLTWNFFLNLTVEFSGSAHLPTPPKIPQKLGFVGEALHSKP